MSLVDELIDAAKRNQQHWIANVVRNRPSMAWDALLTAVKTKNLEESRWIDDGGK